MKKLEFTINEQHIKQGKISDPCLCPAALSLKDMGYTEVTVGYPYIKLWKSLEEHTYLVSRDLTKFMIAFDDGEEVSPGKTFQCERIK